MRKALLLMLGLCFVLHQAWAQRVVTGSVTDADGKPIAATILVKGTKAGSAANEQGSFSVQVPTNGNVLVISSLGYTTREVRLTNEANYNIVLEKAENQLDEVVVVAYGTAKRENFTGSASQLSAKDIANRTLTNVSSAIIGASPGVATTTALGQPGSSPSVRVRGFGSITGSLDPLYVVDGVPYTAAVANINMDDVETLTILKDAATTSLYGARAANGVVMITTKKGRRGTSNINFKYNNSITTRAIQDYDRVNAYEYYPLMWEGLRNSLVYRTGGLSLDEASKRASGLVTGANISSVVDVLAYNPFNVSKNAVVDVNGAINPNAQLVYNAKDLDWYAPISRNGMRNEYSLAASGGMEKTDYYLSFAYTKEDGYIKRSDFERFNGRVNINTQLKSWLRTGFNLAFIKSGGNFASTDGSNSIVNPFFFASRMGPIYPYYAYDPANAGKYIVDQNGKPLYDFGNSTIAGLPARPAGAYGGRHTIAENELSREYFNRNVFNGRGFMELTLYPGLKFTTNLAADYTNRYDVAYQNNIIGDGAPSGRSSKDYQTLSAITFNQLLNYNKKFDRHNFDFLLGHEAFSVREDYLSGTRQGQVVDGNYELINFTTTTGLSSQEDRRSIESYFGNIRYDFNNKYFFTLGGRTDGNSRFKKEFRWGNFWSASAAWVVTNEAFMSDIKFINSLKLRTSYGTAGNEAGIGYYAWQTLYNLGANNGLTPGIVQASRLGNDSISWEKNKQFDIGVDFSMWNNRLRGTIEYYNRVSQDLLFAVPLPLSSGFSDILKNVGDMYNRGVEFQVNVDVISRKDFVWTVGMNAATLKNRITKMPQKEIISGTKKLMEGRSIYDYWLRQWYGVNPENGAGLYVANSGTAAGALVLPNKDTVTTNPTGAKYAYAGTAIPDIYGAFSSRISYKNLSLSALANWQKGGLTYDDTYALYMHSGVYGSSLHKDMLRRWQKPGDITDVPRMDNAQTSNFGSTSTRFLTDASFLNIQNITLSYDWSNSKILNRIFVNSARFYISMENVRMYTKRKGMNPGQSFTGVTSIGYIPARVINFGINVNL